MANMTPRTIRTIDDIITDIRYAVPERRTVTQTKRGILRTTAFTADVTLFGGIRVTFPFVSKSNGNPTGPNDMSLNAEFPTGVTAPQVAAEAILAHLEADALKWADVRVTVARTYETLRSWTPAGSPSKVLSVADLLKAEPEPVAAPVASQTAPKAVGTAQGKP